VICGRDTAVDMFRCYICTESFTLCSKLRFHLQRHRDNCELSIPIMCRQQKCKSSFQTLFNFMRHIHAYHNHESQHESHADLDAVNPALNLPVTVGETDPCDLDEDVDGFDTTDDESADFFDNIKSEAISLVAGLRANSSMPHSTVPEIVQSFNRMASSLTSFVQVQMSSTLTAAGVATDIVEKVSRELDTKVAPCHQPLDFLSSRYRIDKFFADHPLAVLPEAITFGPRLESHRGKSSYVYDNFQYVSVEKTLSSLLQSKSYVEALLQHKCEPGVISHFTDSTQFSEHRLFSDHSKFSLMLQLFYDGLGVTNPLRGQSSLHNVGVFYYRVKNLPPQFNSCFGNVHLLALCYTHDLSVYGYEPILDKFVSEMKRLSTTGFEKHFPILGRFTVHASICHVTADNLALNGLMGFIESFSGSYFCTICYATSDEIQVKFREEDFTKRTLREHRKDLAGLATASRARRNNCRGVKRDCALNEIDGFHVTNNWSLDIMHILFEGVIPVELGCVLYGLCDVDKCLTLDDVNRNLSVFWGQISVENTHKPTEITKIQEPGHALVPSMKAVQYLALLKYLPLAVGKHVPAKSKHWKFLLHLCHLADLLLAPRFTEEMVVYLKNVIFDHLSFFRDLYSDSAIKLRPKHHLLVHLPTIILKSGPLTGMSCMPYELKNSFFKRCAHVVCNFTNICYTLAYRHQQYALYSQLSNNHIRTAVTVGKHSYETVYSLPYCSCLLDRFGLQEADEVAICYKLCVASVEYKQGHCLLLQFSTETGEPVFGKIVSFVSLAGDDRWHFVLEKVQTVDFVCHFHAHEVVFVTPANYYLYALQDVADFHPLHCHSLSTGYMKKYLIRLPYHLF